MCLGNASANLLGGDRLREFLTLACVADADTYENPERGTLTDEQWEGLFSFVQQGGGLFALHTASACWMHSCNQSECQQTHTDCSSNASTAHTPQCENSRKFHVDGTSIAVPADAGFRQ